MTDTELEQLIDLSLAEFLYAFDGMSPEDLQQARNHPLVRYVAYRVCSPAERRARFPASEEFYLAQARLSDERWKFQCQRTSIA